MEDNTVGYEPIINAALISCFSGERFLQLVVMKLKAACKQTGRSEDVFRTEMFCLHGSANVGTVRKIHENQCC